MQTNNAAHDQWALLKNVGFGYELEIISSLLDQLSIPILKKSRGAGGYTDIYMGGSLTGYDIYVPASRLMEAQELLVNTEGIDTELPAEQEIGVEKQPVGYILHYRELFKKLLIIFFIIPSILGLLYFVFQSL